MEYAAAPRALLDLSKEIHKINGLLNSGGKHLARITVEDCLERIPNRFELIHIAAKRVKQMAKGSRPLISQSHNKPAVVALREIAAGFVSKAADTNGKE